jgi:hypothetical protein
VLLVELTLKQEAQIITENDTILYGITARDGSPVPRVQLDSA